jgi:hypothetical protein
MAIMEGTRAAKTWTGEYAFGTDGGAEGAIVLRSNDGPIPSGAYVTGGVLDVTAGFTTGASGTGALHVNGANDLVSATIVSGAPYSTTGQKDIIPDSTGSTAIELTAARNPTFTIATGALTAGAFTLVLFYK